MLQREREEKRIKHEKLRRRIEKQNNNNNKKEKAISIMKNVWRDAIKIVLECAADDNDDDDDYDDDDNNGRPIHGQK